MSVNLPISVETVVTSSALHVALIFSSSAPSSGLDGCHGGRSYDCHCDVHDGVDMLCVEFQSLPSRKSDS